MYYIIYKTTNTLNGKFYIGTHKTKNINDSYLGSGKILKIAIEKYGIENFRKEILFVFDNPEDMFKKEAEIVNYDFLAEENTYNLKVGGFGGWDYINENGINPLYNKNIRYDGRKARKIASERLQIKLKDKEFKEKFIISVKEGLKTYFETHTSSFKGKRHSQQTKIIISNKLKGKQLGNKNSQYGTCWITNGKESKKIKKDDVDMWINMGYYPGRRMK